MTTTRTLAAAVACGLGATGAFAETFIASTAVPPAHWLNTNGMEPLMACVTERSGGEIDFNFFPSGQIASHAASLDALNSGLAQIGMIVTSAVSDKLPLQQITMLPDMGDTSVGIAAAYRRALEMDGYIAGELKANNVVPLMVNYLPPYQIGMKGERIDSVDDIANKKIRVAGGGQVFSVQALDAVPVQISAGDIYVAMQQGTVDGFQLSITSMIAYSLQEVTGSVSTNGNFANAQALFAMDQRLFDELSPENQQILTECGLKVELELATYLDDLNDQLIEDFKAAGVDTYEIPPEALAAINEKLQPVADDYIGRLTGLGLPGQEAYDEYRRALGK